MKRLLVLLPVALLSCGMYPEPQPDAPFCGATAPGPRTLTGSDRCEDFARASAADARELATVQPTAPEGIAACSTVRVLPASETTYSEKYKRRIWTDPAIPNFLIFGQTFCADHRVDLGDDQLEDGVLCHEDGHCADHCALSHEEQNALGYPEACKHAVSEYHQLDGVGISGDAGETVLDGVFDADEARQVQTSGLR